MKTKIQNTKNLVGSLNTNQIRMMWFLLTLILLAIGAGAPEGHSGWAGG